METFDLNRQLIKISRQDVHARHWTIRDAVEGVQIFGGIGSGKTSGSGRMLALKYLEAGFGGLVLTVKPDEKEMWEDYCKLAGRTDDLLIIEPGSGHFFNFLEYESKDDGITENIVELLKTVIRASEEKSSGSKADPFWENALDMLIYNVIDLCRLAYGSVSIRRMYEIVQSLPQKSNAGPTSNESSEFWTAVQLASSKAKQAALKWEQKQSTEKLLEMEKEGSSRSVLTDSCEEVRIFDQIDQFFLKSYINLAEKTRSVIDFSFSNFLFRLLQNPIYNLFCQNPSTFTPDDSRKGKIILINLPVKKYHKIGRDSQVMFKYIWQRAMEKSDDKNRPVFLWADEAQNFLHEHDPDFQATARSSRVATVYISQNLPNYLANMGGAKAREKVNSFLGTLNTKFFHANADIETNRYAAELIGDTTWEEMSSTSTMAGQLSISRTKSQTIDRAVRPEHFVSLKTGGDQNQHLVEAVMHIQGMPLRGNSNQIKIKFDQNFLLTPNT